MNIIWDNIDSIDDYFITYLLYKETKTISQISRIRRMTEEEVKDDIIRAKLAIREQRKNESKNIDIIEYFLKLNKSDRLEFLDRIDSEKMLYFKRRISQRMIHEKNVEDQIALIWAAGETRDEGFLEILHFLTQHRKSDVRRITYSALRKIGSSQSKTFFEKGLSDSNAQTRQYCAKALSIAGDEHSVNILNELIRKNRKFEKPYVIRAFEDAVCDLQSNK
ncbi:MAG: HEAT repeat domain-containing protein [Clostridioides sp.]|jgi:HEAT repeat protein|nr:HEAT repeat domain-containing protein [Clostridioides sp.]